VRERHKRMRVGSSRRRKRPEEQDVQAGGRCLAGSRQVSGKEGRAGRCVEGGGSVLGQG